MSTKGHAGSRAEEPVIPLGTRNGLELAIQRQSEKTLGKIITRAGSPDLIAGVALEPLEIHPDDRGYFTELARLGHAGIAGEMVPGGKRAVQISLTMSYPGTIKAIHYHYEQTDLWAPISGMLQICLYDLRRSSRTFGEMNTLYVGRFRPWKVLIPPGVAHGYKVLGTEPAQLIYLTDRCYNPEDEGRLPYDHPGISYNWETQHK